MDVNANGHVVALYVREDIPSRKILFKNVDIVKFFVEVNFRKKNG